MPKRSSPRSRWNAPLHEAACEWFVEMRAGEPDEQTRRAFLAWLKEAPAHMTAYLEVATLWDQSGVSEGQSKWSVEQLIEAARADTGKVVSLTRSGDVARSAQSSAPRQERRSRWPALAASLLALTAIGAWLLTQRNVFTTALGEQRSFTLPDGSSVQLNALSRVRVRFSASERQVELLDGQALFQVVQDPSRPFVVRSGDTEVFAVGTQFDVNRTSSAVVVTVLEGRVSVISAPASPSTSATQPVLLSAGDQLNITPVRATKPHRTNTAAATAWTQRQLVFEAAPLEQVIDEFNRFNTRKLVIADARLNDFQIDGVFSSTDPRPLIRFLQTRPGIRVTESDTEIVISSP